MSNENIKENTENKRKKFMGNYLSATTEKIYLCDITDEHGQHVAHCNFIDIKKFFDELEGFIKGLDQGECIIFYANDDSLMNEGFKISDSKDIWKFG